MNNNFSRYFFLDFERVSERSRDLEDYLSKNTTLNIFSLYKDTLNETENTNLFFT